MDDMGTSKRQLRRKPCEECGGPKEAGAARRICDECRSGRNFRLPSRSVPNGRYKRQPTKIGAVELAGLIRAQRYDMRWGNSCLHTSQRFTDDYGRRRRVIVRHDWAMDVAIRATADPWADPTFDAVCILMGVHDDVAA